MSILKVKMSYKQELVRGCVTYTVLLQVALAEDLFHLLEARHRLHKHLESPLRNDVFLGHLEIIMEEF